MTQKIARVISILGHPFLTIPLYTLIITFSLMEVQKALFISLTIIGGFFIPISLWNFVKTRKGIYTNFDVSDQKQRNSMYLFAIPALLIVLAVFYFTNQSHNLILVILFALILLISSYVVNFSVKCSGHTSLTIFLSFLVLPVSFTAAMIMLVCAVAIGWSRLALKRHTFTEVVAGMILGLMVGTSMLYFQGYFESL